MNTIKVRKRFELNASDERDLERRIDTFRRALCARGGAILDIKWNGRSASPGRSASIVYHVPLGATQIEMKQPDG